MKHKFESLFNYEFLPFMPNILSLFHHKSFNPIRHSSEEHMQRLCDRLKAFGYEIVPIPGDGNCFFGAYAHQLCNLMKQSSELSDVVSQLGIDTENGSSIHVIQQLRDMIVHEWMTNPHRYQPFLTDSTVIEEAPRFLQSGEFKYELGNTMPLAMTYVLGVPIVIISSLENQGVFRINPQTPITSQPIVMAFNQHGVGQYDAVRDGQASTEPCSCCCGINKKSKSSLSCVNVVGQNASQCKCLRAEHSCHDSCKCMNCGNPHGQHSNPPNPTIGNKRVRQRMNLQAYYLSKIYRRKRRGNT